MNEFNPIIEKLLEKRGIPTEERQEFLSASPRKTYDPFLLLNMEEGVNLVLSAINEGKKICIYGDYDADGITSTVILWTVLRRLTDKLGYHIPSRFEEGYGLNIDAIDAIKADGYDLLVSVDCGGTSAKEVEHAKAIGLDVLVTDHHATGADMPRCLFINPKQPGCGYPFKELAGCGVAFKLAQGIQRKAGLPKDVLEEVLDLVALGTIGDIMPLQDENRTFVKWGMKKIRTGDRKSLRMLLERIALNPETVTAENVAFVIVPHINAAGRMQDATIACDMFTSNDDAFISDAVDFLVANNDERKKVQENLSKLCEEIVEKDEINDKIIIVKPPYSHEGIAGIVSGRLKDKYYRPAIIVSESSDGLKGTGRSIEGINIHDMLDKYNYLFDKFGGHALACGFSISEENFRKLVPLLKEEAQRIYEANPVLFEKHYKAEMSIEISDIDMELALQLKLLEPFGNKNPKPIFEINPASVTDIYRMGKDNQHIKFKANDAKGNSINCVAFNKAEQIAGFLESGNGISVMGSPEISDWNGNKRIQYMVYEVINKC